MLSSHLRLGFPSGLLPSGLLTKMVYAPLTSPMRATYCISNFGQPHMDATFVLGIWLLCEHDKEEWVSIRAMAFLTTVF
jgi:hypothetical protein